MQDLYSAKNFASINLGDTQRKDIALFRQTL
jgi:hypothetical protein